MNIYNLYVTRSNDERKYFYETLNFIKNNNTGFVKIVHLDFKWDSVILNMKFNNQPMLANVYTFGNLNSYQQVLINNLDELCYLFGKPMNGHNLFMYSGHSDGMYLKKKNINILRIEDFCEIINKVLNKKADLIIFDCCLCGNINCLSICKDYTKYIIASTSYWSYMSVLQTLSIFSISTNLIQYSKNIIIEMEKNEKIKKKIFITDYALYEMNESFNSFMNKILKLKDQFDTKTSYVTDCAYYKDIECEIKGLGIPFTIKDFTLFQRFKVKKCHSKKKSYKTNFNWPSGLLIIINRKNKKLLSTKGDIFFKS